LALAAVLAGNAIGLASRPIAVAPLPALRVDLTAATRRLAAAVRIKTISYDNPHEAGAVAFAQLQELLARSFPNARRLLQREIFNGAGLLDAWHGSDPALAPALLLGH